MLITFLSGTKNSWRRHNCFEAASTSRHLLFAMQQTTTSIPHVLGYPRNAAKHSCCILRAVSKHRCMTVSPACSHERHSGTQEWSPEQSDAGSRGPTQLSVRPGSIAAASVASVLQLAALRLAVLNLHGSSAFAAGSQTVPAVLSVALQHRAQRQLQQLRAARMQLQQAQDQAGLGMVSRAPAQEADASPSRQNGAAVQLQAIPSRQELQGTSTHVARQVYNEVANSRNRLSKRLSAANKVGAPTVRCPASTVPALLPLCSAHWHVGAWCLMSCQGQASMVHARAPFSPAPVCTALQECLTPHAAALLQC